MPNKMRDDHHPAIENHGKHMKTSWKMGKTRAFLVSCVSEANQCEKNLHTWDETYRILKTLSFLRFFNDSHFLDSCKLEIGSPFSNY